MTDDIVDHLDRVHSALTTAVIEVLHALFVLIVGMAGFLKAKGKSTFYSKKNTFQIVQWRVRRCWHHVVITYVLNQAPGAVQDTASGELIDTH